MDVHIINTYQYKMINQYMQKVKKLISYMHDINVKIDVTDSLVPLGEKI